MDHHVIEKIIYKEYIVENAVRNKMVVSCTKKLVENKFQTLVLFRQISLAWGPWLKSRSTKERWETPNANCPNATKDGN